MKYQELCVQIIRHVGGKENIVNVNHCVTRLRFQLKDDSNVNTEEMKKTKGVMQVIQTGGQYQVVLGPHVGDVYKELLEILETVGNISMENTASKTIEKSSDKKESTLSKFLILMTSLFQPLLTMFMAGGMIKALLKLAMLMHWVGKDSGTYIILNNLGDTIFFFMPIALGMTAAKRFGLKEVYGVVLGGILCHPAISGLTHNEPMYKLFQGTIFEQNVLTTFIHMPIVMPKQSYAGSVVPVILIVYVASLIHNYLQKKLPAVIRSFFVPFITILVAVPLGFLIVGPVAMTVQGAIGALIQGLVNLSPGIAGFFLGTFWSVLVIMGLHMAVIPMFALNINQYGFDIINPLIFSGAFASMGAVLGVLLRSKTVEEKNICIPAMVATFFGVNEPTLYGVLIPRKKVMYACFISAGIGAAIAGFGGAKLYEFSPSGPLGLPGFINPQGIDSGFISLVVGAVASFVIAAVLSAMLGAKKDIEEKDKKVAFEN